MPSAKVPEGMDDDRSRVDSHCQLPPSGLPEQYISRTIHEMASVSRFSTRTGTSSHGPSSSPLTLGRLTVIDTPFSSTALPKDPCSPWTASSASASFADRSSPPTVSVPCAVDSGCQPRHHFPTLSGGQGSELMCEGKEVFARCSRPCDSERGPTVIK